MYMIYSLYYNPLPPIRGRGVPWRGRDFISRPCPSPSDASMGVVELEAAIWCAAPCFMC